MTKKEIMAELEKKGIAFNSKDTKDKLEALLGGAAPVAVAEAAPIGTNNKSMKRCPHTGQWMNDYVS